MVLTYRFRLLPTKGQHRALETILESQRQLYNAALQERIEAYRKANITRTYFDQTRALAQWRREDPEAALLPANLQRATLKRLDHAFKGFFRRLKGSTGKPGFPRFRGRGSFDTFGFAEFTGITMSGEVLRFKGMPGGLRFHQHRLLPPGSQVKRCIFHRDVKGWSVGLVVGLELPAVACGDRVVGVDLGIKNFAALSNGEVIPSLKAARRGQRRLRILQRALSRKARTSKGRAKARAIVRRCHAAIARRRLNHLHQASAKIVRAFDVIAIEALQVSGLARGFLARDAQDASWGKFISLLRYKAVKAGARVIEVDPKNTTQDCSGCGTKVPKELADRQHECPSCGLSLDRDLNAARNILRRAGVGPCPRNVAEGGMRAGGTLNESSIPPGA